MGGVGEAGAKSGMTAANCSLQASNVMTGTALHDMSSVNWV